MLAIHGAHHVRGAEATTMLADCLKFVNRIDGNTRWQQRSAAFFPLLQDRLSILFDSVPDIETYIEERQIPA